MDDDNDNKKQAAAVHASEDDGRARSESNMDRGGVAATSEEELRARVAALEAHHAALEAHIHARSYADMVNKFGGIPDMPEVSHLIPHEHQGSAEFSVDDYFVTEEDLNFEFNPNDPENGFPIKSLLNIVPLEVNQHDQNGPKILPYSNEATVADYVQHVVVMCLTSLGLFAEGRLCKEMSLFSLRPDLVLVMHKTKGIILIIEVKMPGEVLFTSEGIAKQVADCLLLQYRLGNTTPFVLLTSYREACLCHLKPDCLQTTNDIPRGNGEENADRYRKIVKRAATQLKEGVNLGEVLRTKRPSEASERPAKRRRITGEDEAIVSLVSPEVVYSRPFNRKNMMNAVSLAIVCGVLSLEESSTKFTKRSFWPDPGSSIEGLHPQVEKSALNWARVSNMRIRYTEAPLLVMADRGRKGWNGICTDDKYILCQELGRGNSGKVFLGVDYQGRACALKFYMDSRADAEAEGSFTHEQRQKDRSNCLKSAQEAAIVEFERWKKLQPRYNAYVTCHELNNRAVLRMPVLLPVPPEKREQILGKVAEVLLDFCRKGYLYKEVRWQHIVYHAQSEIEMETELALLDLGSLLDIELLKKLGPTELAAQDLGILGDIEFLNKLDHTTVVDQNLARDIESIQQLDPNVPAEKARMRDIAKKLPQKLLKMINKPDFEEKIIQHQVDRLKGRIAETSVPNEETRSLLLPASSD
ncbi:MAG: hypothetical protein SGILL_007155 [Bacillariaceae sp.]